MNGADQSVTLRRAERHDQSGAARVLATAFTHDPLIAAATSGAPRAQAARETIFRTSITGTLQAGGELVLAESGGSVLGAALIADPENGTLMRTMRAGVARLLSGARFLLLARRLAPGALQHLNDADLASRRFAPADPHHVLVAVGVDESARGRGIGRLLVDHALRRARNDPRSWGVRLETENPANVDRYAQWGFTLLGVVPMDVFDVHVMAQSSKPDDPSEEDW